MHQTKIKQSGEGRDGALPQVQFAKKYGVSLSTVWRAVKEGRLEYIVVGQRKFIMPPPVQRSVAP
jgi:hypothetical protein